MPSAIANKSSARMTKRYSVLRCRAISSTIFRDLADRSIFGEVLLGTWTLTMIDVDCFKCRFYHSKSEVENFRKAPLVSQSDMRHRSNFASVSLEMTSHFRRTHSSLCDFKREIGRSIQSDEVGLRLSVRPPPDRIASRARSDAPSRRRPDPRRPVRAASDSRAA